MESQKKNPSLEQDLTVEGTAETLYQRLGDKWYAFSLVDDEVFVGSISAEEIVEGSPKAIKAFRITGKA